MELDPLPQIELERLVVDPFPGCRKLAFVLAAIGIAVNERVPHLVGENDPDAYAIEIGVRVVEHLLVGNAQRVVSLSR